MRIGENISLYTGRNEINSQETGGQTQRKSLYAGRLGLERTDDMIAQRKAKAQQKAMKIVGDVWAGDKAIDQDQRVRRESIKKMAMEKNGMGKTEMVRKTTICPPMSYVLITISVKIVYEAV